MAFDPNQFLNANYSGKLDTVRPPLQEDDYSAIIEKTDIRTATVEGENIPILRVTWKIIDDAKLAAQERDRAQVNQDIFLELDQNGALDMAKGKNVQLGRLLETLQLNGAQWSFKAMEGMGPCLVRIRPRPDKRNPENVYDEVARVTAVR